MAPGPPAPPPGSQPAPDGRAGPETWTPAHARARQLRAMAFPYGGGHGERHGRGPERSPELTREAVTPRARRLRKDPVSDRSDGGVLVGGGQPGPARAPPMGLRPSHGHRGADAPRSSWFARSHFGSRHPRAGEASPTSTPPSLRSDRSDRRSRRARGVTAAHARPALPRWRPHWFRNAGRSPVPVPWAAG